MFSLAFKKSNQLSFPLKHTHTHTQNNNNNKKKKKNNIANIWCNWNYNNCEGWKINSPHTWNGLSLQAVVFCFCFFFVLFLWGWELLFLQLFLMFGNFSVYLSFFISFSWNYFSVSFSSLVWIYFVFLHFLKRFSPS